MSKKISFCFLTCFLLLSASSLAAEKTLKIELKQAAELGGGEFIFHSINSICEDNKENFYVLDRKAYKVHKFSPTGKLLLSFGNRGQGPGDFAYPHYITISADDRIVVCEEMFFVSYFQKNGKFIERIRVPGEGFSLIYLAPSLYQAWVWKPKVRQQVLMNGKGEIIKTLFSLSKDANIVAFPDESGRLVGTGYHAPEYSPTMLEGIYKNRWVFALSSQYKILVMSPSLSKSPGTAAPPSNSWGSALPGYAFTEIVRDTKPGEISAKEKKVFIQRINEQRSWYDKVKKAFVKKIPSHKNYFDRILVTEKYIFVFRIKADITAEDSPVPVDIFNLRGDFLGSAFLPWKADYISARSAYFVRELEEDLLLVKYNYTLKTSEK